MARDAHSNDVKGPESSRFGPFKGKWKALHQNVTTAQADLAGDENRNKGMNAGRWSEVRWAILIPSWCTSFDVTFYEFVEAPEKNTKITGRWVKHQTMTSQTEDLLFDQYAEGHLAVRIFNIAGTPSGDEHLHALWRGMNKGV